MVHDLFEKIVEINRREKLPILLVEQNAKLALEVSDHAYVINQGKVIIEGDPKELKNSRDLFNLIWGICSGKVTTVQDGLKENIWYQL